MSQLSYLDNFHSYDRKWSTHKIEYGKNRLSTGWVLRKATALPQALGYGTVHLISRIACAILAAAPYFVRSDRSKRDYCALQFYIAAREVQMAFGWLVTFFDDRYGTYIVDIADVNIRNYRKVYLYGSENCEKNEHGHLSLTKDGASLCLAEKKIKNNRLADALLYLKGAKSSEYRDALLNRCISCLIEDSLPEDILSTVDLVQSIEIKDQLLRAIFKQYTSPRQRNLKQAYRCLSKINDEVIKAELSDKFEEAFPTLVEDIQGMIDRGEIQAAFLQIKKYIFDIDKKDTLLNKVFTKVLVEKRSECLQLAGDCVKAMSQKIDKNPLYHQIARVCDELALEREKEYKAEDVKSLASDDQWKKCVKLTYSNLHLMSESDAKVRFYHQIFERHYNIALKCIRNNCYYLAGIIAELTESPELIKTVEVVKEFGFFVYRENYNHAFSNILKISNISLKDFFLQKLFKKTLDPDLRLSIVESLSEKLRIDSFFREIAEGYMRKNGFESAMNAASRIKDRDVQRDTKRKCVKAEITYEIKNQFGLNHLFLTFGKINKLEDEDLKASLLFTFLDIRYEDVTTNQLLEIFYKIKSDKLRDESFQCLIDKYIEKKHFYRARMVANNIVNPELKKSLIQKIKNLKQKMEGNRYPKPGGSYQHWQGGFNQRYIPIISLAESNAYKLLGLEEGASFDQVKKAYRQKALKAHPDKGGDIERFKKLVAAFKLLEDKENASKPFNVND